MVQFWDWDASLSLLTAYNPAVFLTQAEYEKNGKGLSIQSPVERPRLYIVAAGSFSCEDQIG